jgi:FK506-binding protein 2
VSFRFQKQKEKKKMTKLIVCLLLLAIVLIGAHWCDAKRRRRGKSAPIEDDGSLRVDVLLRPADCARKTVERDHVTVHYTGRLTNGDVFDSSYERGEPIDFQLGRGLVIAGWEQGLLGMCAGESRLLTIPSDLGYGERGYGDLIPPHSTLIFETTLVDILDEPTQHWKK